ncbi:MAG: peptidoglycan DD-metalloendopeptidase family protein [Gemmatimonadales bacterium]|nr:peptidoglycan DD-metalloendopeptidase family protein [Gemmatimonadales bacterium]
MSETRRVRYRQAALLVLLAVGLGLAEPATAQQPTDLEKSRQRLEEIRAERERLRRDQERLQGQVRDAGRELDNLERQRDVTNRIVNELERQIGGLGSQLDGTATQLALAQDNLIDRRAVLERRLVDIYKRGSLHTFQVLLAAESFSDLLSRYKYLFLTSRQDRALVRDVERLRNRIQAQRGELVLVQEQLDRRRADRETELRSYRSLADERAAQIRRLRQSTQTTARRLTVLARDEEQLNEVLAALERSRAAAGRAPARPAPGAAPSAARTTGVSTADLGRLDWPVAGRILHNFGPDTLTSGARVTRHGISIAAAAGTPVTAVSPGRVVMVQRLGTYGLSVILEHPSGYFSLYMQLASSVVNVGDEIGKGQTIGTVGGENTEFGPHLYFEIRGDKQIAMDPTAWLRRRN